MEKNSSHFSFSSSEHKYVSPDISVKSKKAFKDAVSRFDCMCQSVEHVFCQVCYKVSIGMVVHQSRSTGLMTCTSCNYANRTPEQMKSVLPVWIDDNGDTHYELPEELVGLSEAEKLLISPLLVYVPLHHMQKGQLGCKGHVCCFEQDVGSLAKRLPRLPKDVALIRVVKKFKEDTGEIASKTFRVRKTNVTKALYWLKKHSKAFIDVEIDMSRLDWMNGAEDVSLPPSKEEVHDIVVEKQVDMGPSPSQVHDVVNNSIEYEEVHGEIVSNTTGDGMNKSSSIINKKIREASQDR